VELHLALGHWATHNPAAVVPFRPIQAEIREEHSTSRRLPHRRRVCPLADSNVPRGSDDAETIKQEMILSQHISLSILGVAIIGPSSPSLKPPISINV